MPNAVRWDGKAKRFYEVWYFIVQRPETGEAFWIRYTLLNPLDTHPAAGGTLWFAYARKGDLQAGFSIQCTWPGTALRARTGAFDVAIGDATLTDGKLRGALEAAGHRVSWDLAYAREGNVHYYFGPLLRRLMERKTSVTLPNPLAHFRGRVVMDGREIALEDAPGHQAHHWGRERARGWRWAHCAAFPHAPGAILEALSADKPPLPTMTFLRLATGDEMIDRTSILAALRNRSEVGLGTWRFTAGAGGERLEVELSCDPRSLLRLVYHSPRYEISHCYNSPVADARVRVFRGGAVLRELVATGTANAEVVVPAEEDSLYGGRREA
jgi:hypothetical protein